MDSRKRRVTTRHRTFHAEIVDGLTQPGCVFCRLGARTVARYLDILAYENVNDIALRATIREAIGLCNRHAWQFVDGTRAPLGSGIIYRDLIRTLQQRTGRPAASPSLRGREAGEAARPRGLVPRGDCVACAALETMLRDCAHQLLQSWSDQSFRAAFAESDGLCWSHLILALGADRMARSWHSLLAAQGTAWDRRVAGARGRRQSDLLWEALSSAPRLNGTQLEAIVEGPDVGVTLKRVELPPVAPGYCPICAGVAEWLARGREEGEGEGLRFSEERDGLLCAVHAWHPRRARSEDDLGLLPDRMRELMGRLSRAVAADTVGSGLVRWAERHRRGSSLPFETTVNLGCPLCPEQLRYEMSAVSGLSATTLCVPHLRVAARHGASFAEIRATTRQTWRTIEGQLDEFIRKHDYRFQRESRGEEQGSPHWAIALVAGVEGVR